MDSNCPNHLLQPLLGGANLLARLATQDPQPWRVTFQVTWDHDLIGGGISGTTTSPFC